MEYLTVSEIADRVRTTFEESSFSQRQMADRIGVSQPAISDALNGRKKQRSTLFQVARELGYQVGEEPHYRFGEPSSAEGNV